MIVSTAVGLKPGGGVVLGDELGGLTQKGCKPKAVGLKLIPR
jgi:hypothetical protein